MMVVAELATSMTSISLNNPLVTSLGLGLIRAVCGWAYHALENGKITIPEWKQLLHTILRFIPQVLSLAAIGIPALAFLTDMGLCRLEKIAKKK